MQHFLYFKPLPQGQGSFRPTLTTLFGFMESLLPSGFYWRGGAVEASDLRKAWQTSLLLHWLIKLDGSLLMLDQFPGGAASMVCGGTEATIDLRVRSPGFDRVAQHDEVGEAEGHLVGKVSLRPAKPALELTGQVESSENTHRTDAIFPSSLHVDLKGSGRWLNAKTLHLFANILEPPIFILIIGYNSKP